MRKELAQKKAEEQSVTYGNVPTFINLRAVRAEDKRHLIIGISNVDEEMRREREHEHKLRAAHERATHDDLTGVKNKKALKANS